MNKTTQKPDSGYIQIGQIEYGGSILYSNIADYYLLIQDTFNALGNYPYYSDADYYLILSEQNNWLPKRNNINDFEYKYAADSFFKENNIIIAQQNGVEYLYGMGDNIENNFYINKYSSEPIGQQSVNYPVYQGQSSINTNNIDYISYAGQAGKYAKNLLFPSMGGDEVLYLLQYGTRLATINPSQKNAAAYTSFVAGSIMSSVLLGDVINPIGPKNIIRVNNIDNMTTEEYQYGGYKQSIINYNNDIAYNAGQIRPKINQTRFNAFDIKLQTQKDQADAATSLLQQKILEYSMSQESYIPSNTQIESQQSNQYDKLSNIITDNIESSVDVLQLDNYTMGSPVSKLGAEPYKYYLRRNQFDYNGYIANITQSLRVTASQIRLWQSPNGYAIIIDPIHADIPSNTQGIFTTSQPPENLMRDPIKFWINDVVGDRTMMTPAFLEGVSQQGGNAKWQQFNYLGSPYSNFLYQGTETRKVSFTLKLTCFSREFLPQYVQKLNFLRGIGFPSFRRGNPIKYIENDIPHTSSIPIDMPRANIYQLTLGDILFQQYGFFQSVQLSWDDEQNFWNFNPLENEIDNDKDIGIGIQLPMVTTVQCIFTCMYGASPDNEYTFYSEVLRGDNKINTEFIFTEPSNTRLSQVSAEESTNQQLYAPGLNTIQNDQIGLESLTPMIPNTNVLKEYKDFRNSLNGILDYTR